MWYKWLLWLVLKKGWAGSGVFPPVVEDVADRVLLEDVCLSLLLLGVFGMLCFYDLSSFFS